jgi:23S rRNA (cytosine1962-C5)-methyltransferase
MARLVLHRGRAKPAWFGHPWIYSQAVARVEGDAAPGDVVDVCDHEARFIGRGFYNPRSQIACRLASWRADEPLDDRWLRARLASARSLRARLGLPDGRTDAFRLVNAEGDGLPGLIVDVYADVAAVQFTALGMKRREDDVRRALVDVLAPRAIAEVTGAAFAEAEGFEAVPRPIHGRIDGPLNCVEDGIRLSVDLLDGQKTGLYHDQRESRVVFGSLARGLRVLDLYCYAGGFALQAARAGALSVTAVDSSPRALARAEANAALNDLRFDRIEADAFRFLEGAPPGSYELVVLDPPKFARSRRDLVAALKGHHRLHALAFGACADGALVLSCCCSQLVTADDFERAIAAGAKDAGRRARVLRVSSQPADHPVPAAFPEGRYLKVVLLEIGR